MSTDKPLDPNAELREQVSALCDGELAADSRRFLLKRLADEAELKSAWSNYHLIGDSLRRQAGPPLALDFAERVQAEINRESAANGHGRGLLRWAGGGAVAAAVAVLAILALPVQPGPAPVAAPGLAVQDAQVAPAALREQDLRPDLSRAARTVSTGQPLAAGAGSHSLPVRYVPVLQADGRLLLVPYSPLLVNPEGSEQLPAQPPLMPVRAH